jgi:hypothetical protein
VYYYRIMRSPLALSLCVAAAVFSTATLARAEPFAVGSTLPKVELPDQHGAARTLDDSVRAVVFSRDMKAGDVVKAAVEKAGPDLFDRNSAVYVVDVKGMPAIIRTLFAMPAMRRRPYKLLVDDEGVKTADFPGGATYPTVLVLDKLRVTAISYPATAEELIEAIEPVAAKTP